MTPDGSEAGWKEADAGWHGFKSVRALDTFDRMVAAAHRRKHPCLLTPGQIAMGRRYAALVERAASDGMALSKLDASNGSGDSGGWMDHHLSVAQELAMLRNRIGCGAAMALRRIRPTTRGAVQRGPIMDRVLVDLVCIKDCTLTDVLESHGWAVKGPNRKAVAEALAAALDRMIGYRG